MAPSMAGNENKTNDDQRGVVFTLKPPKLRTVKGLTTVCCRAIYVCAVNLTLQDSVVSPVLANRDRKNSVLSRKIA